MKESIIIILVCIIGIVVIDSYITRDTTASNSSDEYGQRCLDGVVYWTAYNRLAVKYNRDGTVALCGE